MAMMYKVIAQALERKGLLEIYHPRDYLSFYCLGKREHPSQDSRSPPVQQTDSRSLV